ncbi:PTS fructose transporter subunit IIC, partial [Enterococcus sp. S181_ASV_20]|nr:PTS fructose transporter subunit IIC [Enterococcus sp. S181_ASV_20]
TSSAASDVYKRQVLAGALIPPYVTGISSLLFRKKFTEKERGQGITNLIMGLAGISEGGIPFLLKDPLLSLIHI